MDDYAQPRPRLLLCDYQMPIFEDIKGFDYEPREVKDEPFSLDANQARNYCIYCGVSLIGREATARNSFIGANEYLQSKQYCLTCAIVYAFNPFFGAIMTKDERYKEIFVFTANNPTIQQMTLDQRAEHILMLETALEELLFEKRAEIQAVAAIQHDRLDGASSIERERIKRIDKRYHSEKGDKEKAAIGERQERMTKQEKLVMSLMKAGIDKAKAEEMAKGVK